jgi:hypothetical protein
MSVRIDDQIRVASSISMSRITSRRRVLETGARLASPVRSPRLSFAGLASVIAHVISTPRGITS